MAMSCRCLVRTGRLGGVSEGDNAEHVRTIRGPSISVPLPPTRLRPTDAPVDSVPAARRRPRSARRACVAQRRTTASARTWAAADAAPRSPARRVSAIARLSHLSLPGSSDAWDSLVPDWLRSSDGRLGLSADLTSCGPPCASRAPRVGFRCRVRSVGVRRIPGWFSPPAERSCRSFARRLRISIIVITTDSIERTSAADRGAHR